MCECVAWCQSLGIEKSDGSVEDTVTQSGCEGLLPFTRLQEGEEFVGSSTMILKV